MAIWQGLADKIGPKSVRLDTPVEAIRGCNGRSIVASSTGELFRAKKVIMAVPTNMYQSITFKPQLSAAKQELFPQTMPGVYAKVVINYKEAWWRDANLGGRFTSLDEGPACFTFEASDMSLQHYSLAVFVAGDKARRWLRLSTEEEKKQAVVDHIASMATAVDPKLAGKAQDVLEVNMAEWALEPYLLGGPTNSMGPGLLRKYGEALREPAGDVYFAGGETAYEWKGYLEGAVLAGQRAAKEVIEALAS